MEYTEEALRQNLRTQDGRRVFYLGAEDTLSRDARAYAGREGIEILPPPKSGYRLENGESVTEKPEALTCLRGNLLVSKAHPQIALRGKLDTLEGELLLFGKACPAYRKQAGELLGYVRYLLRCEVLGEEPQAQTLLGKSPETIRHDSQFPQRVFGIAHFMPDFADSTALLELNRLRTLVREAELAGVRCPSLPEGIVAGLNRLSSALYLLMLQEKSARRPGTL